MAASSLFALFGASGAGRSIMPLMRDQYAGRGDCIFVDDHPPAPMVNGVNCLGWEQFLADRSSCKGIAIAIANSRIRQKMVRRCEEAGIAFHSVTAREHVRMDDVTIGEGALISPFTTITSNIRIGRHFHCNIGSIVEHDCSIGDFVTFAPGVRCNGNVHIGDHAFIGSGAMIRQGTPDKPLVIGEGAVVGMGAVVLGDVPAGATVMGNPARQRAS